MNVRALWNGSAVLVTAFLTACLAATSWAAPQQVEQVRVEGSKIITVNYPVLPVGFVASEDVDRDWNDFVTKDTLTELDGKTCEEISEEVRPIFYDAIPEDVSYAGLTICGAEEIDGPALYYDYSVVYFATTRAAADALEQFSGEREGRAVFGETVKFHRIFATVAEASYDHYFVEGEEAEEVYPSKFSFAEKNFAGFYFWLGKAYSAMSSPYVRDWVDWYGYHIDFPMFATWYKGYILPRTNMILSSFEVHFLSVEHELVPSPFGYSLGMRDCRASESQRCDGDLPGELSQPYGQVEFQPLVDQR